MVNRIVRKDVLEDLKDVMNNNMIPGTSDSDVNVYAIEYPVPYGLLVRLKKEIERLRGGVNAA